MGNEMVTREEMVKVLDRFSDRMKVLEERLVQVRQTLSPSTLADVAGVHPPGLCQSEDCAPCIAQAQQIAQAIMGQAIPEARAAALNDLHQALSWAGGASLAHKITEVAEAWVKAGRPEPQVEPALFVTGG